jgi:hypothetical protein
MTCGECAHDLLPPCAHPSLHSDTQEMYYSTKRQRYLVDQVRAVALPPLGPRCSPNASPPSVALLAGGVGVAVCLGVHVVEGV